jgi:hypothetical protein
MHDFRRTAAHEMWKSGSTKEECMEVTGHKTAAIFYDMPMFSAKMSAAQYSERFKGDAMHGATNKSHRQRSRGGIWQTETRTKHGQNGKGRSFKRP